MKDEPGGFGPPRHVFVAPPFDGPPTGGTCYNAALAGELRRLDVECVRLGVEEAEVLLAAGDDSAYWVDTLYLDRLPGLARAARGKAAVRLLAHYLPSLVERGSVASAADLTPAEGAALEAARGALVPSPWLAGVLSALGLSPDRILVVEPGVDPGPAWKAAGKGDASASDTKSGGDRTGSCVRGVVVANLLPGKGILPLLEALDRSAPAGLHVDVIGGEELDPGYARACRDRVNGSAKLRGAVAFLGALPYPEILRRLPDADVLVSASRMESYGMALAAARAAGVPIVALAGGNVASHVDSTRGGALLGDDDALVRELGALAADRAELERRKALARARPLRRTWAEAAREFVAHARELT